MFGLFLSRPRSLNARTPAMGSLSADVGQDIAGRYTKTRDNAFSS
jgi:hypothetical protein